MTDAAQGDGPRVLVVDDDESIRFLIVWILVRHGCRVIEAPDAETALAVCDPNDLDLALIDVEMPGMDGLALMREINSRVVDNLVPVVLVTARALATDVATGLGLGAHDYLRKPFETAELLARVDAALKIKRLQDELRRQNRELAHLSRIDSLTGIFNRRYLDSRLTDLCGDATFDNQASVLMVDIDHFKQVNDKHGHQVGDQVIRSVAERIRSELREGDAVGRWGGEEFLVLLPHTDPAEAAMLAERLRTAVADRPVNVGDGEVLHVTVSIGVASSAGTDPHALIGLADKALYDAKAAGRNRTAG